FISRAQFFYVFRNDRLWQLIFTKDDENKIHYAFLNLLPNSHRPQFINETVLIAAKDMKSLIQLAEQPTSSPDGDYKHNFLSSISSDNLHKLISKAQDIIDYLSSLPEGLQAEAINKIGKDKIISFLNNIEIILTFLNFGKGNIFL